jgi:energy-coupling factor transport system substrate-specific component
LAGLVAAEEMMIRRLLSLTIYGLSTGIGVIAFLHPFWLPSVPPTAPIGQAHAGDAPLMLTLLVGLCFAVLLLEVQGQAVSAKLVALLGILVAMNSILRFVDVAIPGPGGYSPVFFLIIATGYIYGSRFGFLMGALTLLVSALITGGVGPWLPYQMFTAGWVGMSAPLCRPSVWLLRGEGKWAEVGVLAAFGGLWGLLYGGIMNVWFWPFATGSMDQYWTPGLPLLETLKRYAIFYLATSLWWDAMRSAGNVALTLAVGLPTLRVLRRFRQRFVFDYQPVSRPSPPLAGRRL